MVTNLCWTLYHFLVLIYLLILIKLVEFTNNNTFINLLIEPIDNYGLIVVVIMCRWLMFCLWFVLQYVVGHEISALNVNNLIKTYPSTQGEEDEGLLTKELKVWTSSTLSNCRFWIWVIIFGKHVFCFQFNKGIHFPLNSIEVTTFFFL